MRRSWLIRRLRRVLWWHVLRLVVVLPSLRILRWTVVWIEVRWICRVRVHRKLGGWMVVGVILLLPPRVRMRILRDGRRDAMRRWEVVHHAGVVDGH